MSGVFFFVSGTGNLRCDSSFSEKRTNDVWCTLCFTVGIQTTVVFHFSRRLGIEFYRGVGFSSKLTLFAMKLGTLLKHKDKIVIKTLTSP